MGWLVGYTLGSMAAALVIVRGFEAVTDPLFRVPSRIWRKFWSSSARGQR
jgi:hypothetical protein